MEEQSLYNLVIQSKSNPSAYVSIMNSFEPKVRQSLNQTTMQNRDDLFQEQTIKIIEVIQNYDVQTVPSFFEFEEQMEGKVI